MSGATDQSSPPDRSFVHLFLRNPAIVLSVGYLLLSLIGILHSLIYYFFIRVNIFEYWELGDLFLAGFRRPEAFLWSVLALIYVLVLHVAAKRSLASDRWRRKIEAMQRRIEQGRPSARDRLLAYLRRQSMDERLKSLRDTVGRTGGVREWSGLEWFAAIGTFLIVLSGVTFVSVQARIGYDPNRPPDQQRVMVTFADGSQSPPLGTDAAWYVVGRTNRFLILYDRDAREPVVVPWESVSHVRHEALGPVLHRNAGK